MSTSPYRVESFIPIPLKGQGNPKYPWHNLSVGQSFFVSSEEFFTLNSLWNTLSSCRANAQSRTGKRFTLRQIDEHGIRGIRVWRVA